MGCVLCSRDIALKFVSCFINRKDCMGLCTASRAFATCMAEAPSALVQPKVLVWGGGVPSLQAVDIFDPASNLWETFPSAQEYRLGAASTVISGRLYVSGGLSGDLGSTASTSMNCFEPLLGIWETLPPMSQGRFHHAAAAVGARLYVCGGRSPRALQSAECFDTLTSMWTGLPAMAHPREIAEAAVIRNHVYIVGGERIKACSSSERLLPAGNWQVLPEMTYARASGFATAVVTDMLYVCGGSGLTSVERFDPEVGVWELLQPMPGQRSFSAVAVLHGHLYICGRWNGSGCSSSVERFDPVRNTWETLAPMTAARNGATVVVIDGRLFVCGGLSGASLEVESHSLNSAEWFDPVTGRWELLPDMRQERRI